MAAIETVWTYERVERLEEFWASGMSAALIAGALGPGVTRSAVISKVHRLNLPERPTLCVASKREDRRHARRGHATRRHREGARDLAAHSA